MKPNFININIADKLIQLRINNTELFDQLKPYFISYTSSYKNSSAIISIEKKDVYTLKLLSKKLEGYSPLELYIKIVDSDIEILFYFTKVFIAMFCVFYDILFIHASTIEINEKGYLFSGPSGSGKSTIVKNNTSCNILSDDIAVLRMIDKNFFVYTSPFDGKNSAVKKYGKYPLGTIFFIYKSNKNKILKLDLCESIYELLKNNLIYQFFHPLQIFSEQNQDFINFSKRFKIKGNFSENLKKKMLNRLYTLTISLGVNFDLSKLLFKKDFKIKNLNKLFSKQQIKF